MSGPLVPVTLTASPARPLAAIVIDCTPVTEPRLVTLMASPTAAPLPMTFRCSTPSRLTGPPATPVTELMSRMTSMVSLPVVPTRFRLSLPAPLSPPMMLTPLANSGPLSTVMASSPPRALTTTRVKPVPATLSNRSTVLEKPRRLVTVTTPVTASIVIVSFSDVPWMTAVVPVTVTDGTCR